jgi:hypothetical protein
MVREAPYDTVMVTGLACVDEVLEAERAGLCGARYAHQAERQALRAGHVPSSLVLGGRRVAVSRPRVCTVEGIVIQPSLRTAEDQLVSTNNCVYARRLGAQECLRDPLLIRT